MRFIVPPAEYMLSGHFACPGCGGALAMRLALKALGERTIIILPACCWTIIDGPFPYSSTKVPVLHTAFETAASAASGVRAGLDILGKTDINVMAWAGDGGTFDIGIQALSGAAERGDNIIYTCYDNEAYMNTGVQRSSATPLGAWTTTTPTEHYKKEPKKNMIEIMAAHRIAYAATASVAYPDDLIRKFNKAKELKGTKFIHILTPCPPGWKSLPDQSIKLSRLAIHSKVFPIYEVENGVKYTINIEPRGIPVIEYLKPQGRFNHLTKEQIKTIQEIVNWEWSFLKRRAKLSK
jgi:pyruvate ferredoxin oxidoreductase beta subunit/2-oxoisovalerate ferredoxin oxidoreductase beta subunit